MTVQMLKSGVYEPRTRKRVTVWPKPDVNGDGPEVYQDVFDDAGNFLYRDLVTNEAGDALREYLPPAGFRNIPNCEFQPSYTKVDGNGRPVRDVNGYAIVIHPGSALIEHPDGTHELLRGDYVQRLFQLSHDFAEAVAEDVHAIATDATRTIGRWTGKS